MPATLETSKIELKDSEFDLLRTFVYDLTGISFPDHKKQLFQSRLRKRLREHSLNSFHEYYELLKGCRAEDQELVEMINRITTNKTDFFREQHHFDYLTSTVFPKLLEQSRKGHPRRVRIWSAACSSGEEPYSIAMTALEYFGSNSDWDIKILASDIDTNVLDAAREGVFRNDSAIKIPAGLRSKYFVDIKNQDQVEIVDRVKKLITFRRINFSDTDWGIQTKFDVVFCRNAMIYFDRETQARLVKRFANYLDEGKHLFLGHSESLVQTNQLFTPLKQTMFQRSNVGLDANSKQPSDSRVRLNQNQPARKFSNLGTREKTRSGLRQTQPRSTSAQLPNGRQSQTHVAPRSSSQSHLASTKSPVAKKRSEKKAIIVGEVFASQKPIWITTLLGSCVSACLFDPEAKVGGMNHFLLPSGSANRESTSYGIHAMELLINEMMGMGGDRRRMVAKVFGGANVIRRSTKNASVGQQNIEFIREFLSAESIPIVGEKLGGDLGLQIQFLANDGRARVKAIEKQKVAREEEKILNAPAKPEVPVTEDDSITLF